MIKLIATSFSTPRGTMTSAYFFVGAQNSSYDGFTKLNDSYEEGTKQKDLTKCTA